MLINILLLIIMITKLTELLESLNKKEKKELGEFLNSPYYNKNRRIVILYNYLHTKSFVLTKSIEIEKLFPLIYPGKKYDHKQLALQYSALAKMIIRFLAVNNTDEELSKLALLRVLRERKLHRNFSSENKKIKSLLKNNYGKTAEDYLNLSNAEHEFIISNQNKVFLSKNTDYQNSIDALDYYFILRKLIQAVFVYNHKNEVGSDLKYKLRFINESLDFISNILPEIRKKHPVLYCYYNIILMLKNPETGENYTELKNYVQANSERIKQQLLWDILIEMKNYSDNRVKLNREKYVKETFAIYKLLEENEYFKKQKYINHFDFLNTVTVGLILKDFKWVLKFKSAYKNKLSPSTKKITLGVINAEISFHKNDFTSSLLILNSLNYENYYFYLRIKTLMAKNYYELGEIEALFYTIDALKHYLKRNEKILGRYIEVVRNFIHYLAQLAKISESPDKFLNQKNIKHLKEKISGQSSLLSKEWLIEKIDELEKSIN